MLFFNWYVFSKFILEHGMAGQLKEEHYFSTVLFSNQWFERSHVRSMIGRIEWKSIFLHDDHKKKENESAYCQ